ncbi:MAG: flagellar motor protein MotD [Methylotenera sp.]|jgi:chemotaxis protein MotB|uniref:flagellar motor protein MotD n=1 Tax=Methylotenera sp. TaxID=2051956 RepID=UPI000D46E516|nr:flagellar motor protein MotD [Methylotenera sp.]MDP3210754.1 flagellar motor protein MotD [Methylotenera sp.]MDP3776684.1 flagellar motor protein MotD [Methylotenera sp.]PPC95500.1 MAG: flagellar motor protein MotD [Methylotenera sp.]
MSKLIRKRVEEDQDNHDRWLVSYADFITLLFAFFVVMYSISSVEIGKYKQLTNSIGTAFSGNGSSGVNQTSTEKGLGARGVTETKTSSIIKPLPLSHLYTEKMRRERDSMAKTGAEVSNKLAPMIAEGKIQVIQTSRGIRIDIQDNLLFSAGSADLSTAANSIISEIVPLIKDNQRKIQVEGHTDNTPIHNTTFFSNWELSAVRASSVVRLLSALGISEQRLSATGLGASQPISENETESGRAKNRRVSIIITYEVPTQEDTSNVIAPQVSALPPQAPPTVLKNLTK